MQCSKEAPVQESEKLETEKIEVVHPLQSIQYGESYYFENESGWEYELSKLGYTGIETLHQSKTEDGYGFIATADCEEGHEEMVSTFVIFETPESINIETASEYSFLEKYEVCEIDGNSDTEEIMLCFDYMGNGGAGRHETQVWNFDYGMPMFMFSSDCDFGYASALNDGYEVVIDNVYTGYQTRIDCKDNYETDFIFDENGNEVEGIAPHWTVLSDFSDKLQIEERFDYRLHEDRILIKDFLDIIENNYYEEV